MRVKLDYNNLLKQIADVLTESEAAQERGTAFGIAIGLELLSSYLRQIAERAIEIEDEILLGLLKDLCIIKESEGVDNATDRR